MAEGRPGPMLPEVHSGDVPDAALGGGLGDSPEESLRPAAGMRSTLARSAARGALITAAAAMLFELLGAVNGLVVARFIDPRDYGVAAAALFAIGIVYKLRELRISTRLVQMPADPADAYDYGFTLEVWLGVASTLVACAATPLIARVYGTREFVPYCLCLSVINLAPATLIPSVYLQRELRWWRQRAVEAAGPTAGLLVTLVLAVRGAGVWALVLGQLAATFAGAVVLWVRSPRRPHLRRRIPRDALRFFAAFGVPLWLAEFIAGVALNAVVWEVQVVLGLSALGYFRLAVMLGNRIDTAEDVITSVLFPVLCRMPDRDSLRRAFSTSARLVLVWAVPAGFGLALFSEDIVRHVLGARWAPVVPLLRVEGVGEVINGIATMWTLFYEVTGTTRPAFWFQLQRTLLLVLGIGVLGHLYGYHGIYAALFLSQLAGLMLRRRLMRRLFTGVPVVRAALPLLLAGGVAVAATVGVSRVDHVGGAADLVLRLVTFLTVDAALALLLERRLVSETWALLRSRSTAQVAAQAGG